jgi:phenylacetic acid degradation protein
MAHIYSYQGIRPVIDPSAYVHPAATIIGDVHIGPDVYIAPSASLRGDYGRIIVESCSYFLVLWFLFFYAF